MKLPPSSWTTVLPSLAVAGLLAGCASLLGDFSVGSTPGDGGVDAGSDLDATAPVDTGSGDDDATAPDAGDDDAANGQDAGNPADSSSTTDAADAAPPWSPAVLDQAGELAVWLEASSANLVISGGLVESWKDLSKNKNDASNANSGPTVAAAAIHGRDALNFATSGLTLAMADAASLQFGNDQIYITAVARVATGSPYFFSKYTTTVTGGGEFYSTGLLFFAQTGLSDAGATILGPVAKVNSQIGDEIDWGAPCFEDGAFHIVAVRRTTSSSIALQVDDLAPVTAQTGSFDVSVPGQPAYIGSVGFGNIHPPTNFDIAEMLAVHPPTSGVVADTDVAKLHAYLKQKYGL